MLSFGADSFFLRRSQKAYVLKNFNALVAIIAGLLCDKVGRRPLFIASTIGMFVFWVLQTACFALYSEKGDIKAAHTFIAMICECPR